MIIKNVEKAHLQNPHIFTRSPNIEITSFLHTKIILKETIAIKKPLHTNNFL